MTRRPLTEIPAQGRAPQPRRKMEGHKKLTYGKGGTASSKAVLSDVFSDENEIAEQLTKVSLGPSASPLPSEGATKPAAFPSAVSVARKDKHIRRPSFVNPADLSYTAELRGEGEKSHDICDFSAWVDSFGRSVGVVKVAEGSFGEVFRLEFGGAASGESSASPTKMSELSIFKLIPIRSRLSRRSQTQTSLAAVHSEVQMLKQMDQVDGFARFREVYVLQGSYPAKFVQAWDDFKAAFPKKALNPAPPWNQRKQLWAMIEMGDAGKDVESIKVPSVYQVYDIFWTTCVSLCLGETHSEFEHRDLHLSNICINPTHSDGSYDISPVENASLDGGVFKRTPFGYSGLRTTVIDYTISRAKYLNSEATANYRIIYDPITHLSHLGDRRGPPDVQFQHQAYRKMYAHAVEVHERSCTEDPSEENMHRNKWERYLPGTNAIWLHCLLRTLLYRSKYGKLEGSSPTSVGLQNSMYSTLEVCVNLLAEMQEEGGGGEGGANGFLDKAIKVCLLDPRDLEAIKRGLGCEDD